MKQTHRLLRALMLALVACLLIAASPLGAFADDKDYDLASTRVWATVGTDGVVHVSEVRTIDLRIRVFRPKRPRKGFRGRFMLRKS